MSQVEIQRPLVIGIIGYNTDLSFKGLRDLAYDNEEQIEQHKKEYLRLEDGTKIIAITNADLLMCRRPVHLDQLILFDDDRWLIESRNSEMIFNIKRYLLCRSCVPDEYQIIKYEDL